MIDALDTLVVMGLHNEFNKAVDYIKHNVSFDADINVSVFETNIRVVGGLLSAHMLSHRYDTILLHNIIDYKYYRFIVQESVFKRSVFLH